MASGYSKSIVTDSETTDVVSGDEGMAGGKTVIIASLNITLFHHHLQPNGGGAPRKSVLEPSWVVKTEASKLHFVYLFLSDSTSIL